jgi:putative nucleotidyltransferase with HDIG domain
MPTAQELIKKFKDFKTLPNVAVQLNNLIANEKSSMQDYEKVINLDPTLVARLLRIVNSPYYGMLQKIENISRAVMVVGIKTLRNMIVTSALKNIFNSGSKEKVFSRNRLWLHSVAVSICSKMISERIFGQLGDDAFLCGILHDIGIIVEDQIEHDLLITACEKYASGKIQFIECEKEIIETDHCKIGFLMAHEWGLSSDVQQAIKWHHSMKRVTKPSDLTSIVQISDYLVSELDYAAMTGPKLSLPPEIANYLRYNIDEFKVLVKDLPDEVSKANEIFSSIED